MVPGFRAGQLFAWLHKGARFAEMTNLPKPLREQLQATAVDQPVEILTHKRSKLDDTVKFLFGLRDGNCVEGVLMKYHYGRTLCISTQVGCRMGCTFCASTLDGCVRSLTPGEMLGEITAANRFLTDGERVHNVVLMGSGEPLDNYDNVMKFLRLLREPQGLCISLRSVSLSTCGLVPKMYDLANEDLPVTLSVSLHAPNDEVRDRIMPVNKAYPSEELLAACRRYYQATSRRISFEYAMIDGVNDRPEDAKELLRRLKGLPAHFNLIPLNHVEESPLKPSTRAAVAAFQNILEDGGVTATVRRTLGGDIDASCGQLRRKYNQSKEKR